MIVIDKDVVESYLASHAGHQEIRFFGTHAAYED
jgi:hypothetical protein